MAARTLRIKHSDEVRAKIQASQLINRLQNHVLGDGKLTELQLKAAKILLDKALPGLSRVEMSGVDGEAIPTSVTITHVKPEHPGS